MEFGHFRPVSFPRSCEILPPADDAICKMPKFLGVFADRLDYVADPLLRTFLVFICHVLIPPLSGCIRPTTLAISGLESKDQYGNKQCARNSFNLPSRAFKRVVPDVSEVPGVPRDNHDAGGNFPLRVVCQKFEENCIDQPFMAYFNLDGYVLFE